MNRSAAKKRLMFIQKEDYNFLAYNTIILLDALGCTSEEKKFKDFRKIAYLIDFINEGGDPSKFDQSQLSKIYSRAQIKKKLLHHLVIILKNKNFIGVSMNSTSHTIDLWLKKTEVSEGFLDKRMFNAELSNIKSLKSAVRSLRTITIKTLADKVFADNNVITWEV
ncbi:hypothetical protein DSL64_02935 [Dyadobacter luteus]|uniref:Uncharacterized protein n=1 Tax=Dyadobacter luteus TaxID=2259619 RepID=A0A3D8YFD4_9BACT|nr:hypothetical protein [Dyadobacter luteus]REA63418.1 hypothetical protein DSL64_02935 [Dyadobacter luteus]